MAASIPGNTIIRRMRLSVGADGKTVTLGQGLCGLPNGKRLISDGSSSVALSSPTPGWYYAYAYEASTGIAGLRMSTTAPSDPYPSATATARSMTGDTNSRYVGSVYVQANGLVRPFDQLVCTDLGNKVLFRSASVVGGVPQPGLLNFTAATATSLPLNPIIPATATHAILDVKNATNRTMYVSNPDDAPASPTAWALCALPNESCLGEIKLGAGQTVSIILSTAGLLGDVLGAILSGKVNIYVQGYYFDR